MWVLSQSFGEVQTYRIPDTIMLRARKSAPKLANLNHQFAPVLSESKLLVLTSWQSLPQQISNPTPEPSFVLLAYGFAQRCC